MIINGLGISIFASKSKDPMPLIINMVALLRHPVLIHAKRFTVLFVRGEVAEADRLVRDDDDTSTIW